MFKLSSIVIALFITTIINSAISYISWQRRQTKSGLYFALAITATTFWTLSATLGYAAVPLSAKILFAKLEAVGYHSAMALFALLSLFYAGNDRWLKKKWVKALLLFAPLSNIFLAVTNELHNLLWTGFVQKPNNIVVFEHGPAFNWSIIANYSMAVFIFLNLWMAFRKGSDITRRQTRIMMLSLLFTLAINLIYNERVGGIEGVDWTSITFSLSGVLFLYAFYGIRLMDIVPIARDKLFNSLSDGMIVLDMQNRIIDINRVALSILDKQAYILIGKNLTDIIPEAEPMLQQIPDHEIRVEFEMSTSSKRTFDVLLSPLLETNNKIIRHLIIARDITERKQAEDALQQRISEIQELHQNLQENQAKLVEQQRALAILNERQRMGRDMHDSVNQSIHSLMLFSETLIALLEKKQTATAITTAKRIHESGEQALREIRLLLYETQPILADKSTNLIQVLEERLNMVERRVGINSEIIYDDESMTRYPHEWNENLYWILIEALNNALKHARAHNVKISIHFVEKQMEVMVEDDGIGFDTNQKSSGGLGTRTMRERAELLGGQLLINSVPRQGACVHFKIQLEDCHEKNKNPDRR